MQLVLGKVPNCMLSVGGESIGFFTYDAYIAGTVGMELKGHELLQRTPGSYNMQHATYSVPFYIYRKPQSVPHGS